MAADVQIFGFRDSVRRLALVARQTLTEALRLHLAAIFVTLGIASVLMALWLREFNFGAGELKFIADFGLGATSLLGTLLAALATAQLFFDDLESGFAACVLTKSVRRWEYLAGRLAGVMALLGLFVAGQTVALGLMIAVRESQLGAVFVPLPVFLQAGALVWLKVSLVAVMTLLVCSYAGSALFAAWVGLMLAALAHLRSFSDHASWLGWLRVWPNLGLFEVDPLLSAGHGLSWEALFTLGAYWLGFMVLLTGLAAYVFKHREF